MRFVSVRDLRNSPSEVWEELSDEGELVLTNNGRPQALLIEVDQDSLQETIAAVEQARLVRMVAAQQAASVRKGLDRLSMADIDEEIAAARKERHGS
jgi:prevent-host-death family protein